MMNDFQRSNKVTGVYWLKNNIRDLRIRIKMKWSDNIINLPPFEEFPNRSLDPEDHRTEDHHFKWQQKVFSHWEINRYSDPHNCITDNELHYHELMRHNVYEPKKLFTYIHEDRYSLPDDFRDEDLTSCFDRLNIGTVGNIGRMVKDSVSMGHLFRSEEVLDKDHWVSMHVVLDNSDYNEDSQLLFKRESHLLSLHYNANERCLLLTPDVNNLEWNPYTVESKGRCAYGVGINFEGGEGGEELVSLLSKLHKRWKKKNRIHLNFTMPPLGKKQVVVTLEIVSARGFDMDHLHIEFHVKVPEGLEYEDKLQGKTHTAKAMKTDEDGDQWLFGHIVELGFVQAAGSDPPPIRLYFEVISNDWWSIQRTEGYAHSILVLNPGQKTRTLNCVRPEEKDRVEAEESRFFVGGCNMIENLDVLGTPQMQNLNFRLVSTGNITIRNSIITQVHNPGSTSSVTRSTTPGSSSDLLMGAEAVLKQYRKARARLAAATKDLDGEVKGFDEELIISS